MAMHVWFLCVRCFKRLIWQNSFPLGAIKLFVHKQKQTWNEAENMSWYTKKQTHTSDKQYLALFWCNKWLLLVRKNLPEFLLFPPSNPYCVSVTWKCYKMTSKSGRTSIFSRWRRWCYCKYVGLSQILTICDHTDVCFFSLWVTYVVGIRHYLT